jgi:hypothetical protein
MIRSNAPRSILPLVISAVVALILTSGGGAAGSTVPSATLEDECIQQALRKPRVIHPAAMFNAGARTETRLRLSGQVTRGKYEYPALPGECGEGLVRFTGARLEVRRQQGRHVWQSLTGGWANRLTVGNDTQFLGPELERAYGLTPWPARYWVECVHGKFERLRLRLRSQVKNAISRGVVAQRIYTVSVPVHGSCWAAQVSAWETEDCKVKKNEEGVETSVCKHCTFRSQRYHGIRCERLPDKLRRGHSSAKRNQS